MRLLEEFVIFTMGIRSLSSLSHKGMSGDLIHSAIACRFDMPNRWVDTFRLCTPILLLLVSISHMHPRKGLKSADYSGFVDTTRDVFQYILLKACCLGD